MLKKIQKDIYIMIKKYRNRLVSKQLNCKNKTVLDIGCQDLFFYNLTKDKHKVTLADINPKNELIKKEDIQKLSFEDKSFDIVLCQEVLEHLPDPIKAIKELKRVSREKVIITVPNEPFFTMFRFLIWEKEHLWSVTPKALEYYLGKPKYEKHFFLKRYYLGVWTIN